MVNTTFSFISKSPPHRLDDTDLDKAELNNIVNSLVNETILVESAKKTFGLTNKRCYVKNTDNKWFNADCRNARNDFHTNKKKYRSVKSDRNINEMLKAIGKKVLQLILIISTPQSKWNPSSRRIMTEEHFTLSEAEKAELLNAVTSGGVPGLIKHIQMKNCEWKKIPLNIAITGASGVGKSSFINAIRGLTADDEGGAHVDVVEATKDVKPYTHPENENMVFWDLPGVGTPKFPREKYLKIMNFDSFDFFLILAAGRFKNNDL
ncbi:interferon-inducible GTPase 1-like [Mercenaria mercenaria]|uniref:interferon-inducible GTPase 1-like n=1 Tax=Mercenaria mercenaria TaxID=6596 RepID=UPI00234F459C|nr:interferon-inducible GTPase 1-like [Mercenaria mercenaria]